MHHSNLILSLLGTTQQTGSSGSNETSLLTLGGVSRDGGSLANMLMVTTTVRMVDRVHGNTTSLGPRVALDCELVLRARCLQHRLVGTPTTGNDTNHSSGSAENNLLRTAGQLDSGLALVRVVSNDSNVVARCSAQCASITGLLFDICDHGTLRNLAQRQDVADRQIGVLPSVDELSGVHSFHSNHRLGSVLVGIRVSEFDEGQRRSTAWVVDDIGDGPAEVSMSLAEIETSELGRRLVESGVGSEDRASALSLVPDDTTHPVPK